MADKARISLYLDTDLAVGVSYVAEAENRSISRTIEVLVKEALAARGVTLNDPGHSDDSQTGQSLADTPIPDVTPVA